MCPLRDLPFAPSFLPTPFTFRRHYLHFLSSIHGPTKTPIYRLAFSLPQNHDKISFSFSHSKFRCLRRSVVPFLALSCPCVKPRRPVTIIHIAVAVAVGLAQLPTSLVPRSFLSFSSSSSFSLVCTSPVRDHHSIIFAANAIYNGTSGSRRALYDWCRGRGT